MRLQDIELAYEDVENVPEPVRSVLERVKRIVRAVRESLTEVQGQSLVIRYNVPPTTPATAAALPTATVKYLGRLVLLDKNGAANDELYVCRRNNVGAYVWQLIV